MQTNTQTETSVPMTGWLTLLLLSLVWGSSYILIKKGLVAYTPLQLASLRVTISALAFLPLFIKIFSRVNWSNLRYLLVVGFSGSFFPAFFFAFAQTELSSSTTGVLSSLTPLFTLLLGLVLFGVSFHWNKMIGVLIGLAGAAYLILMTSEEGLQGNIWYALLVVMACLMYAMSANTVKKYLQDVTALDISVVSFVLIGIPGVIMLFSTGFTKTLMTHEAAWSSLGYISLLALLGTVMSSILFFRLVQISSALFASTVSYLIPVIALMWGVIDGEQIGWYHLIGMALILFGVYISGGKRKPR